jgi:redox-sensing transcriptional repressor
LRKEKKSEKEVKGKREEGRGRNEGRRGEQNFGLLKNFRIFAVIMANASTNSINGVQLPEPTLRRLPWYLALVTTLLKEDVKYISSTRIAKEVGVDASQIAKDLSFLNIKGKTRIGYEVATLESELRQFLGFGQRHNAVIIGVGSLGSALMRDKGLNRYGLDIVAGFDIDPAVVGTEISSVKVYHIDQIAEVTRRLNVSIATLTVPVDVAQSVVDTITAANIKAIWNFTPCRIKVGDGVVVQNTSIYSHLAVMFNRLSTLDTQ